MFDTDAIRELRLRKWAREHYVDPRLRKSTWHPVVLDEMCRRDQEAAAALSRIDFNEVLLNSSGNTLTFSDLINDDVSTSSSSFDEFSNSFAGSRIVPVLPENWINHAPSTEVQGPHWPQVGHPHQHRSNKLDFGGDD